MLSTEIKAAHPQWQMILKQAVSKMDANYLLTLKKSKDWLPGIDNLFSAFSEPLCDGGLSIKYILLGESPYPRQNSANGYAFWDNAVNNLWSDTGLSKQVNRATSLRNWLKMLLVARGDLKFDLSQSAIAKLDKSNYWLTAQELFENMLKRGFLLLNAMLVYRTGELRFHLIQWRPFLQSLLSQLFEYNPSLQLILLGRIANLIPRHQDFFCIKAEHPYNLSFISNIEVLRFFKPLDLLNNHA